MRRLVMLASLLALLALPARALASDNVFRQVPGNPANRLATLPADDYSYDFGKSCRKHEQKGTLALQSWLKGHAGGVSWGIMRCEKFSKGNYSLHSEGRALDWHLDVHNGADRAEATRLIDLWMAPDKNGNIHALARRMGIQELIWNCKAWFSGDGGLRPYSLCFDEHGKRRRVDDTSAHRNHVHIGLNWAGARMQTTFWQSSAARR
jgi:hypothetical protein